MAEIKIKREIFLDNLPHKEGVGKNKDEQVVDWKKSIGYNVRIIYNDKEVIIKIVDYIDGYLSLTYLDGEIVKITTDNFKRGYTGRLLNEYTNKFKFEIGLNIVDERRNITIIDKQYRDYNYKSKIKKLKWYRYYCNQCTYEGWVNESDLKHKQGCSCCNGKTVIEIINSIYKKAPWMIPYIGETIAKTHTCNSNEYATVTCPECGRVKDKKVKINSVYNTHSIGCLYCSDGVSFAEKMMANVLEQLNINFTTQEIFNWSKDVTYKEIKLCGDKKYDFYIALFNGIIETHGRQHYEQQRRKGARTLELEHENDILKKELAIKNDIKEENYIVIDCSYSELEFVKNNIINSRLNELYDLKYVNWLRAEEYACKSLVKKVCEIKRDNLNMSSINIGNMVNLNYNTVTRYLKQGSKIWEWCKYNIEDEIKKRNKKASNRAKEKLSKQVEIRDANNISLGIFSSGHELDRQSKKLLGVKLDYRNISAVCTGKAKTHKGFTFKYIECDIINIPLASEQILS